MTSFGLGYAAGVVSGLLIAAVAAFLVWYFRELDRDDMGDLG